VNSVDCIHLLTFTVLSDLIPQKAKFLGSTYVCEELSTKMKMVRSKYKNQLGNERLESYVLVATSQVQTDIEKSVLKNAQNTTACPHKLY
jgi:membrane protein insertase Oxa1/YidC/SpoIIIJ